jgi:hypothetical protein
VLLSMPCAAAYARRAAYSSCLSGIRLDPVTAARMDDASLEDDLGEAYDLVEELWTEGQPPSPDSRKVTLEKSPRAVLP